MSETIPTAKEVVQPRNVCRICGATLPADSLACLHCNPTIPPSFVRVSQDPEDLSERTATKEEIESDQETNAPLIPPSLADRFQAQRLLGQGGMGAVYLARDLRLGRDVAVKLLLTQSSNLIAMFETEAKMLAALEHDHIVRIYDYGVANGIPYLVMEYVSGRPLSSRLAEGRPTLVEAIRITLDILKGIERAHAQKIVHRDLKPANIFIEQSGRIKVGDFGLAYRATVDKDGQEVSCHTATGGTPGYMSPEQRRGELSGSAGDIYAVGVLLHEMLTGQRLFRTVDSRQFFSRDPVEYPPPSRVNPCVPKSLDAIVSRALAFEPGERPDATRFISMLGEWLEGTRKVARESAPSGLPPHPYKFLEHYAANDRAIFFGRDAEVNELLQLLENPTVRLVLLFGPCGIGKSSILHAGLVPSIDPTRFDSKILMSGHDPIQTLCEALLTWAEAVLPPRKLGRLSPEILRASPRRLVSLMVSLVQVTGKSQVIVLDQLEEVFTHNPRGSPRIADLFGITQRLVEAQALSFKLIYSFRTEFRGNFYPLEEQLGRHQRTVALREMNQSALVDVIEGPSRLTAYGFRYQDGFASYLAGEILRNTRGAGDTVLPVCQIVCRQLYDKMRVTASDTIGKELYESALGGVDQVLKRYVEERLLAPEYAHNGAIARQMIQSLTVKEGSERFSRPRDEEDLLAFPDREAARQTLERLISDHLVMREESRDDRRQVRLTSEVICPLVDSWSLEASDVDRAARTLARAYRQWDEGGTRGEDLLSGTALSLVRQHLMAMNGLTEKEHLFIRRSISHLRRRRFSFSLLLMLVGLIVSGLTYTAYFMPGTLQLDSEPRGAQVLLGERILGETPLVWMARPGMYSLKLRQKRYDEARVDVRIPAGAVVEYRPTLRYPFGILAVGSDPTGADCEIRSESASNTKPLLVRRTPFTTEVPSGLYRLSVSRTNYQTATISHVRLGANRDLVHTVIPLRKETGFLSVWIPEPSGRVVVAREGSKSPVLSRKLPLAMPVELPVGPYRLECFGPNQTKTVKSVQISQGVTSELCVWVDRPPSLWKVSVSNTIQAGPATGDLDGDGVPDVVFGCNAKAVVALKGDSANLLWTYETKGAVFSTAGIADLDGDGLPDVVIGANDKMVHAIAGKTGRSLWTYTTGGWVVASPVLADLDGDRVPDVVVGSRDKMLHAISGKTGTALWTYQTGVALNSSAALCDLDGDGTHDTIICCGDKGIHAVSGKTGNRLWVFDAGASFVTAPVADDLDGDGENEVVAGSKDGVVHVLSARHGRSLWRFATGGPIRSSAALADLDGDGGLDIAVGSDDSCLYAISGKTRQRLWALKTGGPIQSPPIVGDPNQDGSPEIVVTSNDQYTYVVEGRTGRQICSFRQEDSQTLSEAVALDDLDRDGVLDIVMNSGVQQMSAVTIQSQNVHWVFRADGHLHHPPAVTDLNQDRFPDAVLQTRSGTIHAVSGRTGQSIWTARGEGQLSSPLGLVDVDRDRTPDVLVHLSSGKTQALSGRTGRVLWTSGMMGSLQGEPRVVDLDRDGSLEILVATHEGSLYALAARTGARLWRIDTAGKIRKAPAVADLDRDGTIDFVVALKDGEVVSYSGKTHARLWSTTTGGVIYVAPLLGDFNRDGISDVVVTSEKSRVLALSGKDGKTLWTAKVKGVEEKQPAVGDLNGDGVPDVVVSTGDKRVIALSGVTGSPLWTLSLSAEPLSPMLAYADDDGIPDVVVISGNGLLQILSGPTGRRIYSSRVITNALSFTSVLIDLDEDWTERIHTGLGNQQIGPPRPRSKSPRNQGFLNRFLNETLTLTSMVWPRNPTKPLVPVCFDKTRVTPLRASRARVEPSVGSSPRNR